MKTSALKYGIIFLFFITTCQVMSAQAGASRNNTPGGNAVLINKAYEAGNWNLLEKLQKQQFHIDKDPSRLIWAARCAVWQHKDAEAFFYLDTAVRCGYTDIFSLNTDTAFDRLRGTAAWKRLSSELNDNYLNKEHVFLWGYYYGAIAIMFLLNLVLFFSTKEYSYLFLSLMILADMHLELFNNSGGKIVATRLMPWFSTIVTNRYPPPTFFAGALMIFYLLFSKTFLRIKEHFPRLVIGYNAFIFVFLCLIIIHLQWGFLPDLFIRVMVISAFLLSVASGVVQWFRKYNQAGYFVLAAVIITVGYFLKGHFLIITYSPLSVSMLLGFTVLTLGTANKLKIMRIENERARQHALEMLEEKVAERTAEVVSQKNEITVQKHVIEEKQREILESINYAKRVQQAMLPAREFINKYTPDNFVLYEPKDIVAGDFYWAEEVNGLFFIAAGDSTGHGVPGALVSVVCCNALNRSVKEFGLTKTGEILDKTKQLVVETFEKSEADVTDGMDISLLCLDLRGRNVTWSGANNPLWYVQNRRLNVIRPTKQAIGKTPKTVRYATHHVEYSINTIFYLFTDGYADQFGGEKGKKFNNKQFEALLLSVQEKPMPEQVSVITAKFVDWKGNLEQVDDVCVIGFRL